MIVISAAGIAGIGAWVALDSLQGIGDWAERAAIRGACLALIGLCLWMVLNHRRAVSAILVVGASAFGLLAYETGAAWRMEHARDIATRTLQQLESGTRQIDSLTPAELMDPYIEAYVLMHDVYWELYARSYEEMSRYRSVYEDHTAEGAFLDPGRLATATDLWRSIFQIDDLQQRLARVESTRPDLSDLLLTVNLLDIDDETRAAYARDLREACDALVEANKESVARERETLRTVRRSLEILLDAEGRYRIENGRIIFQHPEDASRFAGKAGAG